LSASQERARDAPASVDGSGSPAHDYTPEKVAELEAEVRMLREQVAGGDDVEVEEESSGVGVRSFRDEEEEEEDITVQDQDEGDGLIEPPSSSSLSSGKRSRKRTKKRHSCMMIPEPRTLNSKPKPGFEKR